MCVLLCEGCILCHPFEAFVTIVEDLPWSPGKHLATHDDEITCLVVTWLHQFS